jgi:hypothetical protein
MWGFLGGLFIFVFRKDGLQSPDQVAARQENPPLADDAFQADICPQADNGPLIRAAGVRFAQADAVTELEIGKHEQDYTARENWQSSIRLM